MEPAAETESTLVDDCGSPRDVSRRRGSSIDAEPLDAVMAGDVGMDVGMDRRPLDPVSELGGPVTWGYVQRARRDSNPQPSDPYHLRFRSWQGRRRCPPVPGFVGVCFSRCFSRRWRGGRALHTDLTTAALIGRTDSSAVTLVHRARCSGSHNLLSDQEQPSGDFADASAVRARAMLTPIARVIAMLPQDPGSDRPRSWSHSRPAPRSAHARQRTAMWARRPSGRAAWWRRGRASSGR